MRREQGARGVNEIFHFSFGGEGVVNTKSTQFMPYHHPRLKIVGTHFRTEVLHNHEMR